MLTSIRSRLLALALLLACASSIFADICEDYAKVIDSHITMLRVIEKRANAVTDSKQAVDVINQYVDEMINWRRQMAPLDRAVFEMDQGNVENAPPLCQKAIERFNFFAKEDMEALRFTLENGGLLLADACCGDATFDKSFRKFLQYLFPEEKLQHIPVEPERDLLFSKDLNGEVLSRDKIKCRKLANGPYVSMEPYLEGIRVKGRWVVIYSKYDLGCALERSTSADCVGYDHASALRIATAAVRYNTRP